MAENDTRRNEITLLDGATGTELRARGSATLARSPPPTSDASNRR